MKGCSEGALQRIRCGGLKAEHGQTICKVYDACVWLGVMF